MVGVLGHNQKFQASKQQKKVLIDKIHKHNQMRIRNNYIIKETESDFYDN